MPPPDPADDDHPNRAAGWVLRADATAGIETQLERFGQVFRVPIAPGPRAAALGAGQPCFLLRTDRSKVVGLWAVGEVVAPTLDLPGGLPLLPGEEAMGNSSAGEDRRHEDARTYAEVELLPLAKAIAIDTVLEDARLARSEMAQWQIEAHPGEPLALTSGEVRAIEAIEWWIDAPTDEQRAVLDALLASEDAILDELA